MPIVTPHTPHRRGSRNINHLRRGTTYRASTRDGTTVGEYLGIEAPYGEWAILLRHEAGTDSIPLRLITAIRPDEPILETAA